MLLSRVQYKSELPVRYEETATSYQVQVRSYMTFNSNSRTLSFQWILAVLTGAAGAGVSVCSVLILTQGPGSLNPSDSKTGLPYDAGSSSILVAKILEVVTPVIL